jgi:hypothetical protein
MMKPPLMDARASLTRRNLIMHLSYPSDKFTSFLAEEKLDAEKNEANQRGNPVVAVRKYQCS